MWVVFPPNLHTTTTVSVRLSYVKKSKGQGISNCEGWWKKRFRAFRKLRLLTSQVEDFWSINKSSTVHQWNTLIDSRLNFFFWWRNLSHPNLPGVGEVLLMIFHPSEAMSFLLEDCPVMFLMEEIMYHLLSMKHCEKWDIDHIWTGAGFRPSTVGATNLHFQCHLKWGLFWRITLRLTTSFMEHP